MIERLAPFVAGLFYGGWAAYSNSEHGNHAALMAFMAQGSFAFVSTWLLAYTVTSLSRFQKAGPRHFIIFLQCSLLLLIIPVILHLLAGTPDILQAMLPGLLIGNTYLWFLVQRQLALPAE